MWDGRRECQTGKLKKERWKRKSVERLLRSGNVNKNYLKRRNVMGRVTQFVSFINAEKIPDKDEDKTFYTHITKTKKLKTVRKKYRINLRRKNNG